MAQGVGEELGPGFVLFRCLPQEKEQPTCIRI